MSHRAAWRGPFILVPGMPRILQLLSAAFAVKGSLAAQAPCPSPAERLANLTSFPAYDKTARPNLDLGLPVDVGVQLYLAAIPEVDQKKQQFVIEGYFRLDWTDNRLATTGGPCSSTMILELPVSSVWQPDIYWDNSLAEWYGTGAMNIYEDGRIYRSVRYKQTLRCPMNFQRLPFDKQRCFALLGSYSWDLDNVNASAFSNGAVVVPEGYDGTTEWLLEEATYEVTTEFFGAGADRKRLQVHLGVLQSESPTKLLPDVRCRHCHFVCPRCLGRPVHRSEGGASSSHHRCHPCVDYAQPGEQCYIQAARVELLDLADELPLRDEAVRIVLCL